MDKHTKVIYRISPDIQNKTILDICEKTCYNEITREEDKYLRLIVSNARNLTQISDDEEEEVVNSSTTEGEITQ